MGKASATPTPQEGSTHDRLKQPSKSDTKHKGESNSKEKRPHKVASGKAFIDDLFASKQKPAKEAQNSHPDIEPDAAKQQQQQQQRPSTKKVRAVCCVAPRGEQLRAPPMHTSAAIRMAFVYAHVRSHGLWYSPPCPSDKAHRSQVKAGTKDDLFGLEGEARTKTEEGYNIYSERELQLNKSGGDTDLCPFDCECCY